jgi:uncharacterized protein (DUF58 family)
MSSQPEILDLLKKVRRLQIQGRNAAREFMAGQYQSVFKGPGIEFREVRDYRAGDDVRSIDWNVTARRGSLHVKTFQEEREQSVLFLVDGSASTLFGSGEVSKSDTIAELLALLGFAALFNNDRIGLILFTDRVEQYSPPRKGLPQGLRILREVLGFDPSNRRTSLASALNFLIRVRRRRAIVFLISDFQDEGYEPFLKLAASRHDLIAIRVSDPRERVLPAGCIVSLRDLETGRRASIDLGRPGLREEYARAAASRSAELKKRFSEEGIDLLDMEAGAACADKIQAFFHQRLRRRVLR